MNNFSISGNQQRKQSKFNRPTCLLSPDASRFNKESKTTDQIHSHTQKMENLQSNFPSDHSITLDDSTRFEMENYFDSILEKMLILPLHSAIEPILSSIYASYKSILWISKDCKSYSYYSPTLDLHVKGEETLLAAAARTKTSIISLPNMNTTSESRNINKETDEKFEKIESECLKMFFPLYLKSGNVIAIAEILRIDKQNPFNDHDLQIASFLIRKFLLYGSALLKSSETVLFASVFSHITSPNNVYKRLSSALLSGFNCKIVDFWCHHNNLKDILKLDSESGEFIQLPRSSIGVVTSAIRNKTNLNAKSPRCHPNFSFNGDPLPDEPILISTYEIDDCIFATVLRGKTVKATYSTEEESKLEAIMPFISRSLLFSINIAKKDVQKKDPFEIQLNDLLDTAAFFATKLTFDDLVKAIQERSAKMSNAKSCSFIFYDQLTNQFILDHGKIKLPGNQGLAGKVATFGTPIRVSSPMSDSRFDKKIDSEVHGEQEIESMLIVPVYSSLKMVIGVISLANKIKKPEFTDEDERIICSIAVLASISLQNSRIYQTSIGLTQKLNSFVHIKKETSVNKDKNDFDSTLIKILKKARNESNAYRATLFLSKENLSDQDKQSLLLYRSIGGPPEQGTRFSLPSFQQRKIISYPINDDFSERSTIPISSRLVQYSMNQPTTLNSSRAPTSTSSAKQTPTKAPNSNKVDMGTSPSPSQTGRLICCTPIFLPDKNDEIVGVIEICVNLIETTEEIDLFQNFCNIVALTISQQAAEEITAIRDEQFALLESIPEPERDLFSTPSIFKERVPENVFKKEFDITAIDSKYLINVVFSIFNKFGLMHEFEIESSKLFLFIYRLKNKYNDEKKWRHSIEVTCFLSYLLLLSKFDEKIPRYELLSLIIASLCHDIEDSSTLKESQSVAFDSLLSKRSIFESKSCFETISLLSTPDSKLLEKLSADQVYLCSELIVQLILSTDYYKHYQLLQDFKALITNGNFKFDNPVTRLLLMQMFLKCSDVGVIGRNSSIADMYQDTICDEFFEHGPYDKAREIVFTSAAFKDRSHIDRKKSKRSILDSVFAPIFRFMLKAFPQLSDTCNCALENIARWTGIPHSSNAQSIIMTSSSNETPNIDIENGNDKLSPDKTLENE